MRVAILTFHGSDNYGSVLQAYALKRTLELQFGVKGEIINYIPKNQEELYALYLKPNSLKNILKNARAFVNSKLLKKRIAEFSRFRKEVLEVDSKKIYLHEELKEELKKYKLIISGSDQIWNPRSLDFSKEYFLPEYNGIKIAYAPSFGNARIDDFKGIDKEVLGYLNEYKCISVREFSGISLIEQLGVEKEIYKVLDPTLLLYKKEWEALIDYEEKEKNRTYFFIL